MLSADGSRLYVANTTSGTVSVIDTAGPNLVTEIDVGLEPSGLASDTSLRVIEPGDNPMTLAAIDLRDGATILLDGQVVSGSIICTGGSFTPYCDSGLIQLTLDSLPPEGLHLLQVQNPGAPLSVELPICMDNTGVGACL